jgi:DNA repair protein RadA/Sms
MVAVQEAAGGRRAPAVPSPATIVDLAAVDARPDERMRTGLPELDTVLGGGLVPGSVVLVGGEPGIGKSTLMLQASAHLSRAGVAVAYVCGEESPRQVALRARRLGLADVRLALIHEAGIDAALAAAASAGASVLVIDSVQAMSVEGLESRAGGPAQLAEAGARIVTWAKANEVATLVTGHVTKAGEIAGPRLLEHLVDVVLYFEDAGSGTIRLLRSEKNRFGATDEVGVFEMTGEGLRSLDDPGRAFLDATGAGASGCAVSVVLEGSRPLAVEIQALAVPSFLATPRRVAAGLEPARLHLLLAVLARRAGIQAGNLDVVVATSGGLRVRDPATDLATLCALASAVKDRPLAQGTAFLGEVALSGAVRAVQGGGRRLGELSRLGFTRCVAPPGTAAVTGIEVVAVGSVREAVAAAM